MANLAGYTFFYKQNGQMDSLSISEPDYIKAEAEFERHFENENVHLSYVYNLYLCEHDRFWIQVGEFVGCSCEQLQEG